MREMIFLMVQSHLHEIKVGGIKVLCRKCKMLIGIIISFPVIVAVRLVSPIVLVRFGMLREERIGHFAANTELYLCEQKAALHPAKAFDIFFWCGDGTFFCNHQLKQMWERSMLIRIWNSARYLNVANKVLPGYRKHVVETSDRDVHNLYEKFPGHLTFTPEEEKRGLDELGKMGIPKGAKFICLIARDVQYLKSVFPETSSNYHDYRDSHISNYIIAAEELAKKGYYIIRMGAAVTYPLEVENLRIIDYATKFRSDFMDIYLSARCHFFLNGGAGLESVPTIFRRPILRANVIPIEYLPTWSEGVFIPKKLWLKKQQRFMSYREILGTDVARYLHAEQYAQSHIELVENTPEEISAVALEMHSRLNGTWQTTQDDEELQRRFWAIFPHSELHGEIRVRIGADFLRNNRHLIR